jgi:hypothetical protein
MWGLNSITVGTLLLLYENILVASLPVEEVHEDEAETLTIHL